MRKEKLAKILLKYPQIATIITKEYNDVFEFPQEAFHDMPNAHGRYPLPERYDGFSTDDACVKLGVNAFSAHRKETPYKTIIKKDKRYTKGYYECMISESQDHDLLICTLDNIPPSYCPTCGTELDIEGDPI